MEKHIKLYNKQLKQMFSPTQSIDQFITKLSQNDTLKKALNFAALNYNVNQNDLKTLTPPSILQHFKNVQAFVKSDQINQIKAFSQNSQILEQYWHPNQFKYFSWISVCLSFLVQKRFQQFNQSEKAFLKRIFPRKSLIFIEYQLLNLLKQSRRKIDDWNEQQQKILAFILKDEKLNGKWNQVAFALFCQSGKKYVRNSHKCRQKWFNYLNPIVSHQKWTLQQDCSLFNLAKKLGTSWSKISKAMNGIRTQHMIKNRFNAIAKIYKSRLQRCSKQRMIDKIGLDLNNKLANKKVKTEESNRKKMEEMAKSKDKIEMNMSEAEAKQNKVQFQDKTYNKNNQQNINDHMEGQYNCNEYFNSLNEQQNQGEMEKVYGAMMEQHRLNQMNQTHKVELVDYISMDFQFKKTIFSAHQ